MDRVSAATADTTRISWRRPRVDEDRNRRWLWRAASPPKKAARRPLLA